MSSVIIICYYILQTTHAQGIPCLFKEADDVATNWVMNNNGKIKGKDESCVGVECGDMPKVRDVKWTA